MAVVMCVVQIRIDTSGVKRSSDEMSVVIRSSSCLVQFNGRVNSVERRTEINGSKSDLPKPLRTIARVRPCRTDLSEERLEEMVNALGRDTFVNEGQVARPVD